MANDLYYELQPSLHFLVEFVIVSFKSYDCVAPIERIQL